jgi:hypothetical protein
MSNNTDLAGYQSDFYGNNFTWFFAYVDEVYTAEESRDADTLLRVAIRILGLHDELAPLADLPLATVLMPNTGADVHDIGETMGLEVGSFVVGFWMDRHRQHPCILGSLPGITPSPVDSVSDIQSIIKFNRSGPGQGESTSVETTENPLTTEGQVV